MKDVDDSTEGTESAAALMDRVKASSDLKNAKNRSNEYKKKYKSGHLDEMASRLKKTTAYRKFATGVNTQTRKTMGAGKKETKTILVTRKGDPKAAAGGGVIRIAKDKYDPSIHNMASE